MSQLRFGIIGCGRIAARHAEEASKQGVLAAVCDIIPEKADRLAAEFGSRAYYSLDALLAEHAGLDLLAVCTPNGLHASQSILALDTGMHVLCEKPLAISSAEGKKMAEAAKRNQRKLFVVKSTRYNPAIAALKKALEANELGRVYSFQMNCFWNRPPSYYEHSWKGGELDGGTLFTQFSHYIDALHWLLGDIRHLTGYRKNLAHQGIIRSEDSGVLAVEMTSGAIGGINWSVNTWRENMEVSLTLIAEKGTVELGGGYMNEIRYQAIDGIRLETPEKGHANDYGTYKGSMSNHDQVYLHLSRALRDDQYPFTSVEDGLKTVETIERIYQSLTLT